MSTSQSVIANNSGREISYGSCRIVDRQQLVLIATSKQSPSMSPIANPNKPFIFPPKKKKNNVLPNTVVPVPNQEAKSGSGSRSQVSKIKVKDNNTTSNSNINDDDDKDKDSNKNKTADELDILIKEHVPISYTNHVINRMQSCVFDGSGMCFALCSLFFLLSRGHIDEVNNLFTFFDIETYTIVTRDLSTLGHYLSGPFAKWIYDHIIKLKDYDKKLFNRQPYYSEVIYKPFYDRERFEGNFSEEWSRLEDFSLWEDILEWEKDVLDKSNYELEFVSDCLVKSHPGQRPVFDGKYEELYSLYTSEKQLLKRYDMFIDTWYKKGSLVPIPLGAIAVNEKQHKLIRDTIRNEITIFSEFHRILLQESSRGYKNLVVEIKNRARNELSKSKSKVTYYGNYIGISNNKALNLETLTKVNRRDTLNIRSFSPHDYDSNINIDIIDDILFQMAGGDALYFEYLKEILGLILLADPKHTYIYMMTGSFESRKVLCELIELALNTMIAFMNSTHLSKHVDAELKTTMRDKRIVVFHNVSNKTNISKEVLREYFNRISHRNFGGKAYMPNVSFILEGDIAPKLDDYKDKVLHINLQDIDPVYYDQIGDLGQAFFVRQCQLAYNASDPNFVFQPFDAPSSPSQDDYESSSRVTRENINYSMNQSIAKKSKRKGKGKGKDKDTEGKQEILPFGQINEEEWSYEKKVVAQFIMRRVDTDSDRDPAEKPYVQEFADMRKNFDKYLIEISLKHLINGMSIIGFGIHMSDILTTWSVPYKHDKVKFGINKGNRTYVGIYTYDHDIYPSDNNQ